MQIDTSTIYAPLTKAEHKLVEKARTAVTQIHLRATANNRQLGNPTYIGGALIFCRPLRLDFRAHQPGEFTTCAYIGPQLPLTNELFDGEKLHTNVVEEVTKNFNHWITFLEKSQRRKRRA